MGVMGLDRINGKRNRRQTERRDCLQAMPRCEGGKACEAGLKRKTKKNHTPNTQPGFERSPQV